MENLKNIIIEKNHILERNLYQVKLHIENKIKKRFKEIFIDSIDNLNALNITGEIQTNQIDYINSILKNPHLLGFSNFNDLRKDNLFDEENLNIITSIDILNKNSLNITFDSDLRLNKKNKNFSQNYELNIDKTIKIPYSYSLFGNKYIMTNNSFSFEIPNKEFMFTHGFKIPNFFFNENIVFKYNFQFNYEPYSKTFAYDYNKLGLNFNFPSKLKTSFTYDLNSNNLESHISSRINKSHRITLYANFGKSKTIFGFQKTFMSTKHMYKPQNSEENYINSSTDYTGKYSNQNAIYLHERGLIISSQNSINFKLFGFDFDTSINVIKKENIKFNTIFTFGFRINKFNFKIPIKISKTKNLLIFSIIFMSNWFGSLMSYLYFRFKKYYRKTGKYYLAVTDIIKEKYEFFLNNSENIEKYNRIVSRELEINGLIINYAFIGNLEDIEILNYEAKLLGISKKEILNLKIFREKKIYDIKMALTMKIVESKIVIKNDIFDVEGIYNTALNKYDNIGIIICYTYKFDTFFEYFKNVEKIKIPLVES